MGLVLIVMLALVAVVLGSAAALGFATSIYLFKRQMIDRILGAQDAKSATEAQLKAGLGIAVLLPVVSGLAYMISTSGLIRELFGDFRLYWVWAAAGFVLGFLLGLVLRNEASDQSNRRR